MLDRLAFGYRRKLPLVLQTEAAECGLACVCMVAGYHGGGADLAALRRHGPCALHRMSFAPCAQVELSLGVTDAAESAELLFEPTPLAEPRP